MNTHTYTRMCGYMRVTHTLTLTHTKYLPPLRRSSDETRSCASRELVRACPLAPNCRNSRASDRWAKGIICALFWETPCVCARRGFRVQGSGKSRFYFKVPERPLKALAQASGAVSTKNDRSVATGSPPASPVRVNAARFTDARPPAPRHLTTRALMHARARRRDTRACAQA